MLNRSIFMLIAATVMLASCNKEEAPVQSENDGIQPATRALSTATFRKSPIQAAYVEVNDTNPQNAMSYTLSNGTAFYDVAIIFAANIRGVDGQPQLYFNENVNAVLSNAAKYIVPLQNKGIKVVLSILGDHTGLGVANMTDTQVNTFAQQLANAVATYKLDGIDFDDEYAEYGTRGYPYENATSYSNLLIKLRSLMPADKLITVFDWGYTGYMTADAVNCIDFAWYGVFYDSAYGYTNIPGLPLNRWSPQAINLNTNNNATNLLSTSRTAAQNGAGAIMTYDLRNFSHATYLNAIARGAYNMGVTYDGTSYSKDW